MLHSCPACGSKHIRAAHRRGLWETVLSIFGYCPVRCRDCGYRAMQGLLWLPGMGFARCPGCLREDLTDWEEKYCYPPRWQQALLHFGAKAHRCAVCRKNFVSFRPRRPEFVGSWKTRKVDTSPITQTASVRETPTATNAPAAVKVATRAD